MKYLLDTDHISFLQRRSGHEFIQLSTRIAQYPMTDFALSVISFHEQGLGAHTLINRAPNNRSMLQGYTLLSEILKGFSAAPVITFEDEALAIFLKLKQQKVRVSTMDLRISPLLPYLII